MLFYKLPWLWCFSTTMETLMNKYSDKLEDAYWLKELGETGWYEAWETKC